MLAQFMNGQSGSIENLVGHRAYGRKQVALERNRFKNRTIRIDRVRPSRLTESPDENGISRLKKPQRHFDSWVFLQLFIDSRKRRKGLAFADVDHEGDLI